MRMLIVTRSLTEMAAAMQGVTFVDLSSEVLDNILRQLGLAPRAHCAAASTCTALRCRYVGGATTLLPRLSKPGTERRPSACERSCVSSGHCVGIQMP